MLAFGAESGGAEGTRVVVDQARWPYEIEDGLRQNGPYRRDKEHVLQTKNTVLQHVTKEIITVRIYPPNFGQFSPLDGFYMDEDTNTNMMS